MGGLEAKSVDGSWVLADPVPGEDNLFIHCFIKIYYFHQI